MHRTLLFLVLACVSSPLTADSAWTTAEMAEIEGYAALEGVVILSFKDAVTGRQVPRLSVTIDGVGDFEGENGRIRFDSGVFDGILDSRVGLTVTAPGYIPYEDHLRVRLGSPEFSRFLLSPEMPVTQVRFVVDWGRRPSDVDVWLRAPDFTISYRDMNKAQGKARLDRDARSGFGPETITLLALNPGAVYLFSVENYSKDGPLEGLRATVYANNRLDRTILLPRSNAARVDVLRLTTQGIEYLIESP